MKKLQSKAQVSDSSASSTSGGFSETSKSWVENFLEEAPTTVGVAGVEGVEGGVMGTCEGILLKPFLFLLLVAAYLLEEPIERHQTIRNPSA